MTMFLQIRLRRTCAALERVLGVVRFRGFKVESLHVEPAAGEDWQVAMMVKADTPRANLVRQLEKLHDVERVFSRQMVESTSDIAELAIAGREDVA